MFGLGMPELIVILLIIMVIFGAGKLPEIGKNLGKAIRGFKQATSEPPEVDITPKEKEKLSDKESKEKK